MHWDKSPSSVSVGHRSIFLGIGNSFLNGSEEIGWTILLEYNSMKPPLKVVWILVPSSNLLLQQCVVHQIQVFLKPG